MRGSDTLTTLASAEHAPPRAIGRYLLFGELAAGGMASVHLGRLVGPVGFSRTVAIKRLHPQLARDPDGVAAFLDEARLTARVQHPNVAQTLDVVEMPNELFLVMEYVRGETLSRLMRATMERREKPPVPVVLAVLIGALYGLHAAHEAKNERGEPLGIVHRDVSPQNLIVGVDGVARVLDFGVAKAIGRVTTTSEGQVKGKLAYMPPEQLSSGQVDRRTDVYAAAVILWEMLCARRLFAEDTHGVLIGRILRGDIEPPRKWLPDLSAELEAVVMKGLSLDPEQRFATAQEMATALERLGSASPREVGAWVESIAGPVLALRAGMVAEVESASFTGPVPGMASATSSENVPRVIESPHVSIDVSSLTERTLSATASSPSIEAAPLSQATATARKRMWIFAAVAAVAVVIALIMLVRGRGGPDASELGAAPSASASAPATSASAPAVTPPVTPPTDTVSAAPSAAAVPGVKKPGPGTGPNARGAGKPRSDCNPPYRIDGDGIKHMKPECF